MKYQGYKFVYNFAASEQNFPKASVSISKAEERVRKIVENRLISSELIPLISEEFSGLRKNQRAVFPSSKFPEPPSLGWSTFTPNSF